MIKLDNSVDLQKVLDKKLPPGAASLTPGSALTHILLDQVTDSELAIVAYGVEGVWSRWLIPSACTVIGTKYLLPLSSFKESLTSLSSFYSLQIRERPKGILLETYSRLVNNKPEVLDTKTIPSFIGDIDEFDYPELLTDTSLLETVTEDFDACCSINELQELIWQLSNFGDHGSRSDVILLKLSQTDGLIAGYSRQQYDTQFYIKSEAKAEVSKDFSCVISGVLFTKLASIESLTIYFKVIESLEKAPCLLVIGSKECFLVPILDSADFSYMKEVPNSFIDFTDCVTKVTWMVSLNRLLEALTAQQPDKNYNNRHITLRDDITSLALGKQADILTKDYSTIDLLFRHTDNLLGIEADQDTNSEEDSTESRFTAKLSSTGLLKSLKVLKHCLSAYQIESTELVLKVFYKNTIFGKRWVLNIEFPSYPNIKRLPVILGGIRSNEEE
jgi:hypothetical protein